MLTVLATTSASEEIDKWLHLVAFSCFALAGLIVLITAGLRLFAPAQSRIGARLALAGTLLGSVAVVYGGYMYLTGFVPVTSDGAPASAPLWVALLVPCAPFFANLCLLIAHRRQAGSPQE
jgi:hypothetical protein